jgi:broad specificity phosphatase PhoE
MLNRIKQKLEENITANDVSFWFVRHSKSEGNLLDNNCPVMHDTELSELGKVESKAMADYLSKNNIEFKTIYTSPLKRSYQTADIIAKELNIPAIKIDGLKERDWGIWHNLPWSEVSEKLTGLTPEERQNLIPEKGESWLQMEERLTSSLETIAEACKSGDNVLIVTHRGCLRAIMPVLAQVGREKHEDFSVETGSLSKFSFNKDAFDFVGLNPSKI